MKSTRVSNLCIFGSCWLNSGSMINHLYYGDNLEILRANIADENVDLIQLDPPVNSQANDNILFRAPTRKQSEAQIEAFEDTWHWNPVSEKAFADSSPWPSRSPWI